MTTQQVERLTQLIEQLAEKLMTAAFCADEIRTTIRNECERTPDEDLRQSGAAATSRRPLLDTSSFSVLWRGKSLKLGHTRPFWILHRLAQCPNRYVTHLDLLNDVWDDEDRQIDTIRSSIRNLKSRLRSGGLHDLAEAIHGHRGHYALRV